MGVPSKLLNLFGETTIERFVGLLGLVAVTVAIGLGLMDVGRMAFIASWCVAGVAIVGWNVLVLVRQHRQGRTQGPPTRR